MPAEVPPGHRAARAVVAVVLLAVCAAGIALVFLTGWDDRLIDAGTGLAERVRAAWPG
jgi:hypothetical protein